MSNETAEAVGSTAASWFPTPPDSNEGPDTWRLDVVTLLAVIGESSMAEHSQAITASFLCLMPRLLPAPQALLKPARPVRMPETHAKMTGVYSGVVLDTVGFFANIIHPLDELRPFAFRVLRISHKDRNEAGGYTVSTSPQRQESGVTRFLRRHSSLRVEVLGAKRQRRISGPPADEESGVGDARGDVALKEVKGKSARVGTVRFENTAEDAESGSASASGTNGQSSATDDAPAQGIRRRRTVQETVTDMLANPSATIAQQRGRPAVPPKLFSPVHILTVLSFCLSAVIIGTAIKWQDGNAALAIGLVSLASSVIGVASWWKPILMNRSHTNKVPDGDVVIRTREGAFILIRCTEEVARELYSSLEECNYYVGGRIYRLLMGIGTVFLMVAVVLLGNCNFPSQVFIGASYIVLNGLYWAMGMLPKHLFWDLSRYDVVDETPDDSEKAHENNDPTNQREGCKSFTRTLWYAIRETRVTGWVERGGAAPRTPQWKRWLDEAEREARAGNRNWPAVGRKDDIMREDAGSTGTDTAEQSAPATYVQNTSQNPSF